ncbi:MAG: glycoside-pentoside-hexuronide (GPH):cation symporter [Bacteroidota bacterium]
MGTQLSQRTYFGYGLGDFGQNILFQASIFHLSFFYVEIIGIDAAWLAGLFLAARIWDGINDPLMGYLAERNKSKWGTYRPFLLWGAIPLALSMFLLFFIPGFFEESKNTYVLLSYLFFGMAFTAFNIPYGTLTAVMTQDYHERGKLTGFRMTFAMLGGILGATLILPSVNLFGGGRTGFAWTGAIFGLLILFTSLGSFFSVKEQHEIQLNKEKDFGKNLNILLQNRPFWLLSLCFAACFAAYAIFASSMAFYCQYILGDIQLASSVILVIMGITAAGVPLWTTLSPKLGKRKIFLMGALCYILAFLGIYFLDMIGKGMIYPLLAIYGIGNAAAVYTSWAILPDTIEYGEWKNKKRVEGLSYGIYGFCFKAGLGIGSALALALLDASGYIPNQDQSPEVQAMLIKLVSLIPMALIGLAAISLWFYPITAEFHKKMRAEIEVKV